jgi:hypothetical protein
MSALFFLKVFKQLLRVSKTLRVWYIATRAKNRRLGIDLALQETIPPGLINCKVRPSGFRKLLGSDL